MISMKIKNSHIKEAQNILISGDSFDENRLDFIECLNTCDLIAVPGSGKTTALLAKLYCISKHLPFNDDSGILILSHTHASVNEIKDKLKKHCPSILSYPNFIGTIQGFINRFLTNAANFVKYGSYIKWNDNDLYFNEVKKFYYSLEWQPKGTSKKYLRNMLYGKANFNYRNKQLTTNQKNVNTVNFLCYLKFNHIDNKILYGEKNATLFTSTGKAKAKYDEIATWKTGLLQKGLLSFYDSFELANWFLQEYSTIIKILQNRFKYVFIDEMQDLETFQIDIIDKIFQNDDSTTIMQRVGDINQAIYNPGKKIKIECDWKTRESINPEVYTDKYITGSPRLTEENAKIVNCFTLDSKDGKFKVEGLRKLNDVIPPHLIVFKKETIGEKLKAKFIELIKRYKLTTIQTQNTKFKIIGWAGERENDDKDDNISLRKLFNYNKVSKAKKETFDTLSEHLQLFDKSDKTLKSVKNSILNIFVRVLQFEEKKIIKKIRGEDFERFYTKTDILNYFKYEESENVYTAFKNRIYHWCISIIKYRKCESVYKSIVKCIQSHFANYFELGDLKAATKQFIGYKFIEVAHQIKKNQEDELEIEIATVHSVKGETHCATMYVETYFHKYETQKIKNKLICPLFGHPHQCQGVRAKEAVKMMYVGFSRPTHLLCFAALEENVIDDLEKYKKAGWKIETV